MTRAELAARHAGYLEARRRFDRRLLFLVPLILVVTFGSLAIAAVLERRFGSVALLVPVGLLVGGVVALKRLDPKEHPDRYGLACPSCARPLVEAAGHVAVATGTCPRCTTPITGDAAPLPDLQASGLGARLEAHQRTIRGPVTILVGLGLVTMVGFFASIPLRRPGITVAIGLFCAVTGVIATQLGSRSVTRHGLRCHACKGDLAAGPPNLLQVTGTCPWCGTRIPGTTT